MVYKTIWETVWKSSSTSFGSFNHIVFLTTQLHITIMQFSTIFVAVFATLASSTAVEKRIDIPGLKCGGLDALSEYSISS